MGFEKSKNENGWNLLAASGVARVAALGAVLSFCVVLSSCQSLSKSRSSTSAEQGRHFDSLECRGKVFIAEKSIHKKYLLRTKIRAHRNEKKLRLDVTAAGGYHLASVAVDGSVGSYILVPQKKYEKINFESRGEQQSLKELIQVPLAVEDLQALVFDRPLSAGSPKNFWTCTLNDKELPKHCVNKKLKIELRWQRLSKGRRVVHVSHPRAELKISFYGFKKLATSTKNIFHLQRPVGW